MKADDSLKGTTTMNPRTLSGILVSFGRGALVGGAVIVAASEEFVLPDGEVFFADTYTLQPHLAGHSCTGLLDITGTYSVLGGTGAYAGVTGGGTFIAGGRFVAGRDANGDCLDSESPPIAFFESVRGVGTTTLP